MLWALASGACGCWRYELLQHEGKQAVLLSRRPDPESKSTQRAVGKASNAAKRAEAEALRSVLASVSVP